MPRLETHSIPAIAFGPIPLFQRDFPSNPNAFLRSLVIFLLSNLFAHISLEAQVPQERLASTSARDAKLFELQEKANSSPAREIHFTESRRFPFRKAPVVVEGIIRLWEGHGLSIAYPENKTAIIVDDEGILLRMETKDGKIRERTAETEKSETATLLAAAFGFDPVALERVFNLSYQESSDQWTLNLSPKDADASKLEGMQMSGIDQTIQSIHIDFGGKRSIEITPEQERALDEFPDSIAKRFFRMDDPQD